MKKWIGTIMNWVLPGAGHVVLGPGRIIGALMAVAMAGLTYVELALKEPQPNLYWIMFASVMIFNTAFAVDSFQKFKKLEAQ